MKCRKHNNQLDMLKQWFLNDMVEKDYDKETIRNFENFMYRIRSFEVQYTEPKLINEYNYEELLTFLKSLGSSSQESLVSYMNMIRRFFLFCIQNGKMDDSIDFTRTIDYKTLVRCTDKRKNKHRYVTDKVLNTLLDKLVNDTDKAYVQLIYEGFGGKENHEIINMKKEDIDFENNIVKVYNVDGTLNREVKISEKLADTLDRVIDTDIVYRGNDYDSKKDTLIGSEYVFRPSIRFLHLKATKERMEYDGYNGKHIDSKTLISRLHKILRIWGELDYVSPNTLYRSGVINRAIRILGMDVSKQTFSEWIAENEGYSLCVAYKMYPIYQEICNQMKEEDEQELENVEVEENVEEQ